jgi:hypothetical protein
MPVEQCVWLNNVKGLFPEPGKTSEQHEEKTVMLGENRSFHLAMEDDELLSQHGIFHNQIGTAASYI